MDSHNLRWASRELQTVIGCLIDGVGVLFATVSPVLSLCRSSPTQQNIYLDGMGGTILGWGIVPLWQPVMSGRSLGIYQISLEGAAWPHGLGIVKEWGREAYV